RVLAALLADPDVDKVVVLDQVPVQADGERVASHRVDLVRSDLEALVWGADTIVHLAFTLGEGRRLAAASRANLEGTRRLLAAASAAGISHLVVLSSATVYG